MTTQDAPPRGDVLVPLTPLDAAMGALGLTVVFVFPPPPGDHASYDLERVHSTLVSTIAEDYPHFVVERVVDPTTGAVGILQTAATRGRGITFVKENECELTTEQAVELTPRTLLAEKAFEEETMTFKATLLRDGGLALGINATHALLDGETMFTFFKIWSLRYRGVAASERPVVNHDRHLLMPRGTGFTMKHPEFKSPDMAQLEMPADFTVGETVMRQQVPSTAKRPFHLTATQLKKLKETVSCELQDGQFVSTIDIVTALFTILITQARGHGKNVKVTTGVNARSRFDPPLPPHYAGNCIFNALSSFTNDKLDRVSADALRHVALRIRASILQYNEVFMRDAIEFITQRGAKWIDMRPGTEFFFGADLMLTSWANMGMHDADFGGGKPVFVGPPSLTCDGLVIIMEGINHATGLDVMPLLACETIERLSALWDECELLKT